MISTLISPSSYNNNYYGIINFTDYFTISGNIISYKQSNNIDLIDNLSSGYSTFNKTFALKELQAYYDACLFFHDKIITSDSYIYIGEKMFNINYTHDTETSLEDFKLSTAESIELRDIISYSKATTTPKLYIIFLTIT